MCVCVCLYYFPPEKVQFKDVRFLVVDEADTLFDQSFIDTTTKIIEAVNVCLNSCGFL